jgi:NAD(P)-dependent dehydrogenase (short-subunit alcohol dehydrogenase family)
LASWVITGANRGIGRGLVEALLKSGERVIATHRPGREGELAGLVSTAGGRLKLVALDVGDPLSVAGLGERVGESVDVLINNAGVLLERNSSTLDPGLDWATFETSFRINAIAPLFITRTLLPLLNEGGKVIAISTSMSLMSSTLSDTTAYRASKTALNKIVQGLARDLVPRGIMVAAIHPGWVRTDMGGATAPICVEESAAVILQIIRDLTAAGTGLLYDYHGRKMEW